MDGDRPISITALATALALGRHELVSFVGGGGKTTALFALGRQLAGPVILTTTTKMGRDRTGGFTPLIDPDDGARRQALARDRVVLVWRSGDRDKALGVDPARCGDWYDEGSHVVVEADGSRRQPFKAPRPYEPVVPRRTTVLVACVGAAALDAVIAERCQRPDLVAELAGCGPIDRLTPSRLAAVLTDGNGSRKDCPPSARFAVMVNQVTDEHASYLASLVEHLGEDTPVVAVAPFGPDASPEAIRS